MKKQELVDALATATRSTKAAAEKFLAELGNISTAELKNGGEVPLPGIGKLKATERAARSGRNPKSGEAVEIPASKSAKLTAAKELKDKLNA